MCSKSMGSVRTQMEKYVVLGILDDSCISSMLEETWIGAHDLLLAFLFLHDMTPSPCTKALQ